MAIISREGGSAMKRILTAVLGMALLATPAAAFAQAPYYYRAPVRVAPAPVRVAPGPVRVAPGSIRVAPRPGFYGPVYGVHPAGNRVWLPGYWGFRSGVRTWFGPAWSYSPYAGWVWVGPHWAWNGFTWVWQTGYWAPPV
jgi:hypothetical protein